MATRKIAVLVGSLRKESFTLKVAKTLVLLAPTTLELEIVEIGQLEMYNQDFDPAPPPTYPEFREKIGQFDGFLFCTPEYNRSIPAVLKNAIDIGTRPGGQNIWNGKPGAIVSVSPGSLGGFGANHHLRQTLMAVNVPTMQQPEAYVSNIGKQFEGLTLTNDATKAHLQKFVDAFATWVERHAD